MGIHAEKTGELKRIFTTRDDPAGPKMQPHSCVATIVPPTAQPTNNNAQYKILTSGSSESTPMTPERASRLEAIGFVWATRDPRHVPWETRYDELCEFKKKYGEPSSCIVPRSVTTERSSDAHGEILFPLIVFLNPNRHRI